MVSEKSKSLLERIAKKFGKTIEDINRIFEVKQKIAKESYEMSDNEAEEFAVNATLGELKNKSLVELQQYNIVFTATDGRVKDWAEFAKRKVQQKIDELKKTGVSAADILAAGLVDKFGRLLYPKDDIRHGKPIPVSDKNVVLEGVVKQNNKLTPVVVTGMDPAILSCLGHTIWNVNAFKQQKSTPELMYLKVYKLADIQKVDNLPNSEFRMLCETLYGKTEVSFDKLIEISENLPVDWTQRRVTLRAVQVSDVRVDIGDDKSILVVTGIPDETGNMDNLNTEKYHHITVWLPRQLNFVPNIYQVLNIYGTVSTPNPDRAQLIVNALAVWCEDKYLLKKKPKFEVSGGLDTKQDRIINPDVEQEGVF